MKNLNKYIVPRHYNIRDAVKILDDGGIGFCACCDANGTVIGVITDGDFRRGVLKGLTLEDSVSKIINEDFISVRKNYTTEHVESVFKEGIVKHIPLLENGKLVDIITDIDGLITKDNEAVKALLASEVVIMAGGFGTRLDPFTRILPKPLIPIGNDPIIKIIMDRFHSFGIKKFNVTLNDKAQMVKLYFHDYDLNYIISYTEEEKPLGTAGALKLLEGKFKDPIFLTNCDIIVKCDYNEILEFHLKNKNDVTIVGSYIAHSIPYGVCEIVNGGNLVSLNEKPQLNFLINTGFYLINPEVINSIPRDTKYDMTDLINDIKSKGMKIGVFPVSENSWQDIGQWSEYRKTLKSLEV